MIVWPQIRDTWIWCVEWTVGLTVWCLAGVNLLGRLALQRWSRARRERKSQRNSAGSRETESAVAISMPAETAHSAAIDKRRKQVLAGPRRASNLSTTRRAAVSVVLLLLGWYCLTPGRDTNVTFDGSSISLTPQVIGPARSIAERTELKTGRNPVSPSASATDTDGDAATISRSVPSEIALRLRVAERKRHDALQGMPQEIIDAIENPDVDIRNTIDGVRDPSRPVNDELTQALVHQIAGLRTLNASFVAAQEIVDLEERIRVRETVAAQMLAIRRGGKKAGEELARLQDSLGLTDAEMDAIVGGSGGNRRSTTRSTLQRTDGDYSRVRERVRILLNSQFPRERIEAEASVLIKLARRAETDESSVLQLLSKAESDAKAQGLNRAFAVSTVKGALSYAAALLED